MDVVEMEFFTWFYLIILFLEAAPSKHWPIDNMIFYFVKIKVVVMISYLCWVFLLELLNAYKYAQ